MSTVVILDGESLTCEQLVSLSGKNSQIKISEDAWVAIRCSRLVVNSMLQRREVAYGINTGFGLFSDVTISEEKLEELQRNLIRSHSAGVGEPLSYGRSRMLLALRINVLCRGNSGIGEETLQCMINAFNAGCISVIPSQGTVGASGDLAPLSHLALGLMGEGLMWNPSNMQIENASDILRFHKLTPVQLGPKEGLALINGTQMITALGSEAVIRARNVALVATIVSALTIEVLKGTVNAFHPKVHERRAHKGQGYVAAKLRSLLHPGQPSELFLSHRYAGRVQDAYSLRCTPQVHGVVLDTIDFVEGVLEVELNSSTDNPMVFTGSSQVIEVDPQTGKSIQTWPPQAETHKRLDDISEGENVPETLDDALEEIRRLKSALNSNRKLGLKKRSCTLYDEGSGFIISGGNFHGEYPAKVLDYLAIGVSELASISERRIERMVNPQLSNLPAFLVEDGGLNSGFMIAHCTAAALVSENKGLCHPASVDSISTSAAKEDHVSMGGFAARKALQVVENVERVVAIELLAACQALEFHRPLTTTPVLEKVVTFVREKVAKWEQDRIMNVDIDFATELVKSGKIANLI